MKPATQPRKELRLLGLVVILLAAAVLALAVVVIRHEQPKHADLSNLIASLQRIEDRVRDPPSPHMPAVHVPTSKRLLFYNRPPKTGSTTVRIAMKKALDEKSLKAAKCFNMIEWNEMAVKTIVNRRDVDFYGCHTRMTKDRHANIAQMRNGNVTFITNTREPENIVLSAYLQANRDRNIADITDDAEIAKEVEKYKEHIERYPVDALYKYHGADHPLTACPSEWLHEDAMRRIAERYEVVIDLTRPEESAAMVEIVTGLRPDFTGHYNERTTDTSGKMLSTLKNIDTSHRTCGNELVHRVLMQQFHIIKDRLMQNRCFNEDSGTGDVCNKAILKAGELRDLNRAESYAERRRLETVA